MKPVFVKRVFSHFWCYCFYIIVLVSFGLLLFWCCCFGVIVSVLLFWSYCFSVIVSVLLHYLFHVDINIVSMSCYVDWIASRQSVSPAPRKIPTPVGRTAPSPDPRQINLVIAPSPRASPWQQPQQYAEEIMSRTALELQTKRTGRSIALFIID